MVARCHTSDRTNFRDRACRKTRPNNVFFNFFYKLEHMGKGKWTMDGPQRVLILSQFLNLILFELHRGYVHIMSAGLIPHLIFSN